MAVATAPRTPSAPALPAPAAESRRPSGRGSSVLGVAVVIAIDAMFLGGLLAAYFAVRAEAFRWPPQGVHLDYYVPTTITLTAFMSAVTAQWAIHAIRWNDRRHALVALLVTAGLGLAMVNAEWFVGSRAGFSAAKHAYATLFLSLNLYQLANALVGVAVLVVAALRTGAGHFDRHDHDMITVSVAFWQWVNSAWVAFFVIVWLFR